MFPARTRTSSTRRSSRSRYPIFATGPAVEALERRELLTLYQVGVGMPYAKLSSVPKLAPGDVVEISPGTYNDAVLLTANGTPSQPITIRGVGATKPVLDGTGVDVSGSQPRPRALIEVDGSNYVIDNLELRKAHNSSDDGSGIRVLYGNNVTVRNCLVHDNDMGMMTYGDSNTLIEHNEFVHNGSPLDANHLAHNLYLESESVTVQYNYIHDAWEGQNVKSRSHYTALLYNVIADSNEGEVCLVDGHSTGTPNSNALMVGNVVISKPNRTGNQSKFIDFGQDNGGVHTGTLYLANNTLIAGYGANYFLDVSTAEAKIVATNNIFSGSNNLAWAYSGGSVANISGTNNWVPTAAAIPAGFANTTKGTAPGFVNASGRDYHLTSASAARDTGLANPAAVDGSGTTISAAPQYEYVAPLSGSPRANDGRLDLGAFEYTAPDGPPAFVAAPTNLTAVAASPTGVNLSWTDNATNETGYRVERSVDGTSWTAVAATLAANTTAYSDSGLAANTTYQYRVEATAATSASAYSNTAVVTTPKAPAVVRQFDFGTSTSPLAAGNTRVTESTRYSASAGFGWQSGGVDSRDRGAVNGASALTEDFDLTADATFAVDLANGTYDVTVTLGDASYAHGPQGVYAEGTQVDSVKTAAGQFAVHTYRVTVSDGQLTLRLKNLGFSGDTVCIDGLQIAST